MEDSIDINYKYENGYSALDYAIERGYKNTFSRLAEFYSTEYKNVLSIESNSVKL